MYKEMLIIKYVFWKSKQLIFLMVIIGLLIILCLSNFIEAFKMVNIPANGLTKNYFAFSIGEFRDKITENNITLSDMLQFLKDQESELILFKESETKIFGVYTVNHKFEPNIVWGRTFSQEDFMNKTNTIIISEELNDKCIEKNGEKFYGFDANYFEVIGVFKSNDNIINKDALAYYNLASKKITSKNLIYDNYILGNFQIDAGDKTKELVKNLDDYCTVKITRSIIDNSFSERLQKTISSQSLTLFPVILIIFMIILNSISVSSNWIENRKKEIFIRRLVGATNGRIAIMLFKDFFLIATFSYIVALLLAIIMSKVGLITLFNFKLSIATTIISYGLTMITGLISSGLLLMTYYKNSISQIRG